MQAPEGNDPRTVHDPTTGRPILLAPRRQQRPMHTGPQAQAGACPFCQGQETETPPEVGAVRDPGTAADAPGWTARAFANKYPANHHHEVVAEGRAHCEQPCELSVADWRASFALCRDRIAAIEARPGIACAFLFKNVGALAGASIAHNHSQLLGLPALPPRLQLELRQAQALAACPWCATLATAAAEGRLVHRTLDHSYVQNLINQGQLSEAEAHNHPHSNILMGCLGTDAEPPMDVHTVPQMLPGDTLLLCSDGLWHYFMPNELGNTLHLLPPREACELLIGKARTRAEGGGDNLSLAVIRFEPL